MFKILFYKNKDGKSELKDEIRELAKQSLSNKNARIQFKQINYCINLLEKWGTALPEKVTKHLKEDIWELRPGNNRILYFFFEKDTYVLLHMFKKKTQKTPKQEIEKALKERNDYRARNGGK